MENARILIVEDDPDYAVWLELALQQIGVGDISKVQDGEEAFRLTESTTEFDLIICDWMMPKMDGIEFLKRYREKVSTSMFLILTVKSGLEDAFEATQAGASNYLVKPLTAEMLQEQVVSMLR